MCVLCGAAGPGSFPGFGVHAMPDDPQHSGSYASQEPGPSYTQPATRPTSLPGHPGSRFIHQASPLADSEPLYAGGTASDPLQTSAQVGGITHPQTCVGAT